MILGFLRSEVPHLGFCRGASSLSFFSYLRPDFFFGLVSSPSSISDENKSLSEIIFGMATTAEDDDNDEVEKSDCSIILGVLFLMLVETKLYGEKRKKFAFVELVFV